MVSVQQDLMDKGFMAKLTALPEDSQKLITSAEVNHFYPWRTVDKEDSISTPVRMVVDPQTSGLNDLLAKGQNVISKVIEIVTRNRIVCDTHLIIESNY